MSSSTSYLPSASDLGYFVEVASAGNLSRAADRLGISQPSLTLAMQRLEQGMSVQLFLRSKRGVTLTSSGRQLLLHARSLLQEWEKIRSQTLKSSDDVSGSYVLGCHPSVALYSLPHFLPDLMVDYPHLELRFQHDLSRRITEGVISLRVDLGIVVNPVRHPDLVVTQLCKDEVGFWISKNCRLKPGLTPLICDPDLLQTQELVKRTKRQGIQFSQIISTSSLEVARELAVVGAGISILPTRVANMWKNSGLRRISEAPVYQDEICLIYRVEQKSVRALQLISDRIRKAFA